MYGERENSRWPRTFLTGNHFAAILLAWWILFGDGTKWIDLHLGLRISQGNLFRRQMILACSLAYFVRIVFTSFILLKRRMGWGEALTIAIWLYIVHLSFALVAAGNLKHVGVWEISGLLVYVVGSCINTGSEFARMRWKKRIENRGKLYTGGLFRYSMHINYFGDILLFTGFAIVAHNVFAFIIPGLMFLLFAFVNVPALDKYLAEKYTDQFTAYSKRTSKLIPFLY